MLSDNQVLGTIAVTFVRRTPTGTRSNFVPSGDTPIAERKLVVSHEVLKSGSVNTLYSLSHVKINPASVSGETKPISVQVKISHPSFATAADVALVVDQVKTGLTTTVIGQLFNQES